MMQLPYASKEQCAAFIVRVLPVIPSPRYPPPLPPNLPQNVISRFIEGV